MFTDNARFADCSDTHRKDSEFEVLSNDVLQVSGVRNCQMITVRDNVADEHMIMVNLHLHNPAEKLELGDYLRGHQCEQMLHWLNIRKREVDANKVFVFGDFNTEPGETPYRMMKDAGFLSAYEQVHGKEPEVTFPTGIQAPFMDPDPPACFDYIFYQGTGIELCDAQIAADKCVPGDPTLYASDHKAIVVDFKI